MTVGAFAVVAARERELGREVTLDDDGGLRLGAPVPRRGDVGVHARLRRLPTHRRDDREVLRLLAAYKAGWWWLVVIGVVATAVSIPYYLCVVRAMYMRPSPARGELAVAGGSPPVDPALDARDRRGRRGHGRLVLRRPAADRPRHGRGRLAAVLTGRPRLRRRPRRLPSAVWRFRSPGSVTRRSGSTPRGRRACTSIRS